MDFSNLKKALNTGFPVTIALIGTYNNMFNMLKEMTDGTDIKLVNIYASFEQAMTAAQEIENDVDVILTRGGTGHYVKQSVSIPVISVPISPFDILMTVLNMNDSGFVKKIAFVNYQREIMGMDQVEKICGKEIRQYQFTDLASLKAVPITAQADGCDFYIGGEVGKSFAITAGMGGVEVEIGPESAFHALSEAVEVVKAAREDRKKAARLSSAFDAMSEGICVADELGKISVFNPAVAKMYGLSRKKIIGMSIYDTPVGKSAIDALDDFNYRGQKLENIGNRTVSVNHIPIFFDKSFIGTVSMFQDVSKIQKLEGQIRQQLSQKGFTAKYRFDDIRTQNPNMQIAKKLAEMYAKTNSAILLEGESGTGKELFAHSIHNASENVNGPFVSVNCAAIPEQLLESELFGYAPGAFTGAKKEGKPGLFELAHNGTIFLDEIGEMPKYLQARLLRVLQEKEIMRVGDSKITSVNCRIISATNKDLRKLVLNNEFREDLYYRLSIFVIKIPPLRERPEDILLLKNYFFSEENLTDFPESVTRALDTGIEWLSQYSWPGNVRELKSTCSRLAVLKTVENAEDYVSWLPLMLGTPSNIIPDYINIKVPSDLTLKAMLAEAEDQFIDAMMLKSGGNHTLAAKQLGIGRTTLWRRLESKKERVEEDS